MHGPRTRILKGGPYRESDSGESAMNSHLYDFNEPDTSSEDINRFGEKRFRFNPPLDDFSEDDDAFFENEYDFGQLYESNEVMESKNDVDFTGLGPKGYQRKKVHILEDACEILARDKYLDASNIEIGFNNRVLLLRGEDFSRRDKKRAEALVENIPGILDVANQLEIVNPLSSGWISDFGSIEDEA